MYCKIYDFFEKKQKKKERKKAISKYSENYNFEIILTTKIYICTHLYKTRLAIKNCLAYTNLSDIHEKKFKKFVFPCIFDNVHSTCLVTGCNKKCNDIYYNVIFLANSSVNI